MRPDPIKTLQPGAELHYPHFMQIFPAWKKVAKETQLHAFVESGAAHMTQGQPMGVGRGSKEGKAKPLYRELSLFVVFVSSVHKTFCHVPVPNAHERNTLSRRSEDGAVISGTFKHSAWGLCGGKMPSPPEAILGASTWRRLC